MERTLLILVPEDGGGEAWTVEIDGQSVSGAGLARLDKLGQPARLICVVPGDRVAALSVSIPARSDAEARRAAPFAIEEDIAQSPDKVHVALGPRAADGSRPVRVVSLDAMAELTDWLKANRLDRAELVADFDLLGAPGPAVAEHGQTLIAALPAGRFTLAAALPDATLGPVFKHAGLSPQTDIFGALLASRMDTQEAGPAPGSDGDYLLLLARRLAAAPKAALVNLRDGAFAPRRQMDASGFRPWRGTALLAAALGVAVVAKGALELNALRKGVREVETATRAAVAVRFPDFPANANPASFVQGRLTAARAESADFETLSAVLYAAVAGIEGCRIESLRMERGEPLLVATVSFPGFSENERLAEQLRGAGVSVTVGDLRQVRDRVVGDVRIGGGA